MKKTNEDKLQRGSFDHPIDHAQFLLSVSSNGKRNSHISSGFAASYEQEDEMNYPDTDEWSCEDIYQTPSRGSRKRSLRNKFKIYKREIKSCQCPFMSLK